MKPKDILQLAVRLLGLVFLYHGLRALPLAVGQIIGSFPRDLSLGIPSGFSFRGFLVGVIMAGWPLLVSYWLLRGAPLIMRIAYPDSAQNSKREEEIGGVRGNKADV